MSEPLNPLAVAKVANQAYDVRDNNSESVIKSLPPGFVLSAGVSGRTGLGPGRSTNFGYVATRQIGSGKELLIAIRGTATLFDGLTDALLLDLFLSTASGVHAGFARAWESMRPDVDLALPQSVLSGATVHCVGHSLGGALATLAANHLSQHGARVLLYTFGSPRVGGADFCSSLTSRLGSDNIFRVYHPADPVAMVPLFPFTHAPWGRSGCAIACGPEERISVGRHSMTGYVQAMQGVSFAQLTQNGPQRLTDHYIEHWLQTVKNGGWVQNWGARAAELIGVALEWVLRKLLEGGALAATLQSYFASGVAALDVIAYALHRAQQLAERTAWYVESIIQAIMQFIGRTWDRSKSLTYEFLRWALETAGREMRRLVSGALNQLPR